MGTPIRGYDGAVTVSGVTVAWIKSWEATVQVDEVELGPLY